MTRVAVLDMAGTTVADDGVVLRAFDMALDQSLPSAPAVVGEGSGGQDR